MAESLEKLPSKRLAPGCFSLILCTFLFVYSFIYFHSCSDFLSPFCFSIFNPHISNTEPLIRASFKFWKIKSYSSLYTLSMFQIHGTVLFFLVEKEKFTLNHKTFNCSASTPIGGGRGNEGWNQNEILCKQAKMMARSYQTSRSLEISSFHS